jgi:hypothetical protein
MKELTILEIAEVLNIPHKTVTSRIRLKGIKEIRKVGRTNIYDPEIIEQIRYADPVGPKVRKIWDDKPKRPRGRPRKDKIFEPIMSEKKGKKTK